MGLFINRSINTYISVKQATQATITNYENDKEQTGSDMKHVYIQ